MRYLLFIGSDYYPSGGWNDFVAGYHTLEAAIGDDGKVWAAGYEAPRPRAGKPGGAS